MFDAKVFSNLINQILKKSKQNLSPEKPGRELLNLVQLNFKKSFSK